MSKKAIVDLIPLAVPPVTATTLDPANTNAKITLSGGNLTATCTSSDFTNGSRSVAHYSTGKFYYEADLTVYSAGTYYSVVGIGNASFDVNGGIQGWSDSNAVAWRHGGAVVMGSSTLATIEGFYPAPNYLCVAVDLGAKLFWGRVNGGNWNNNAAYDPAAGSGGIDISGMSSFATVYAAISLSNSADVIIMNFGGSAYAYTQPSGFGNW